MRNRCFGYTSLLAALIAVRSGAITVDGTVDAEYGAPAAIQTHQTQFGDSNAGLPDNANGSELANGYWSLDATNLYLVFAGNLEGNFNKLNIFIDSRLGGQNKLRGDNPVFDFNGLNRMGDDGSLTNGLKFDADFAADFYFCAGGGGSPYTVYFNYSELLTSSGGTNGYYLGGTTNQSDGTLTGGGYNPFGIRATIDNSNVGGVSGGSATSAPFTAVATGIELAIPLASIGYPCGTVKVCAFISSADRGYVANQVLPGFATANNVDNFGEPRDLQFDALPGPQYFTAYIGLTNDYNLAVTRVRSQAGTELAWPSLAGKTYLINKSTNLLQGFTLYTNGIVATAPTNTFLDIAADPNAYYQIQAESGCP